MKRTHWGLIYLGSGVGLNLLGRVLKPAIQAQQSVTLAGLLFALMLISVVLALFGLYRFITGISTKS